MSILLTISWTSCNKLVEIPPAPNSINGENAFKQDNTAAAVINGLFLRMNAPIASDQFTSFASIYPGLMADELSLVQGYESPIYNFYYRNDLTNFGTNVGGPWVVAYNMIGLANDAIDNLIIADKLSPKLRNQLLGQAYYLRAFGHFYLAATYGNIPLVLSTDYKKNMLLSNTVEHEVYTQVIADLRKAKELIDVNYLATDGKKSSNSRITPNKAAVSALLARAYLYHRDFALAVEEATNVINQSGLYKLESLDRVFIADSEEAIWQLQPTEIGVNTYDARTLVIPELGPDAEHPLVVNPDLLGSFEAGDQRKSAWIGLRETSTGKFNYVNKYKVATLNNTVTEYKMVLRLAEIYLIRAEGRAETGDLDGARSDINRIRTRAGLGNTPATSKEQVLAAITKERRYELFTEWGDRWFNLRRTGQIEDVMSSAAVRKESTWRSYQQLMPIPAEEIRKGINLKQNPGY